jgi:hypothetical protein
MVDCFALNEDAKEQQLFVNMTKAFYATRTAHILAINTSTNKHL